MKKGRPALTYANNLKDSLEMFGNKFDKDLQIYFDSLFSYREESILESLGKNEYEQKEKFSQIILLAQEVINNCDNQKIETYKDKKITEYIRELFIRFLDSFNQSAAKGIPPLTEADDIALDLALNHIDDYGLNQNNLALYLKIISHGEPGYFFSIRSRFEYEYNQNPPIYYARHQEMLDAENELFLYITKSWKETIEDLCREKGYFELKKILLCQNKIYNNCKKIIINNQNMRYQKINPNIIADYLDFLCKNVFWKETFWKMVDIPCAEIKQEYLNSELTTAINKKYDNSITIRNLFFKGPLCNEYQWFCPKDAKTVFEENFIKYRYQSLFCEMYLSFLEPKESRKLGDDKKILLQKTEGRDILYQNSLFANNGPSSRWNGETPENRMRFKFREWNSLFKIGQLSDSMLHQMLGEFLASSKRPKKETIYVNFDETTGYTLIDENGCQIKKLWGIKPSLDEFSYQLDSYFSYEYQIKDKNSSATKIKRFGPLLDDMLYIIECLDFTEIYNIENTNQLFTAWKLYDTVLELISWPHKNPDNEELNKAVYNLSGTIGHISDLEMRIAILDEFSRTIPQIKEGHYNNALEFITHMTETIADLSEEFNQVYNETLSSLVWQFAKEDRWKHLLWMKNRKTEGLSQLIDKVQRLNNGQGNDKSLKNFRDLYSIEKAAGEKYSLFLGILKNLKESHL
ncbi:MAG: hypothetical protein HFH58_14905 [Lachnospiraceae bacterium]|nr:hypothetical protein [Lachnospiraceae bacterium]